MTDKRAFLIVMDSVGIGGAPDADQFFNGDLPDTGANTVAHIAQAQPLHMPNLARLGLGAAVQLASGQDAPGLMVTPQGLWGGSDRNLARQGYAFGALGNRGRAGALGLALFP